MSQLSLSAKNLKETLWTVLEQLKSGEIPVNEVLAIANVAKEITRCTNTQLKISVHTGRELSKEVIEFSEN